MNSTIHSTNKEFIMSTVSAAEIKQHGVSRLAPALEADGEAIITVRGKERYVVMTMDKYNGLRESELVQAVRETRADYKAGRIDDRTIDDHMRRLNHDI
jgi:PHD/YefM family antitoxin component YafN of YafNO toxin-antitoxin module